MPIELEQHVVFAGADDNLRLSNGHVELVVPVSYGPRIMRYGRPGKANLFAEVSPSSQAVQTSFGDDWHIYGGHRLWAAPEDAVSSYYPDNAAVAFSFEDNELTLRQPLEASSGLEKSLSITLHEESSHVSVLHLLTNRGERTRELAPWALSAMAPHGTGIFPQAPFVPHPVALAPARPLVLWPFTRMNDTRSTWGDRLLLLRQDTTRADPQKFGFYNDRGYMAYALDDQLFIKCHLPMGGAHADFGCNAQTFTNELFLELETLGPLVSLAPGQTVSHREEWFLFGDFSSALREPELVVALTARLPLVAEQLAEHGEHSQLSELLRRAG